MRPDLSFYATGLSGAAESFLAANQPVFNFHVSLRAPPTFPYMYVSAFTCIRCVYADMYVCIYDTPFESIRAGNIVTSVASVHHHSLFFVSFPIAVGPPVSAPYLPPHGALFSSYTPLYGGICHPKRYTEGTEPRKNRAVKETGSLKGDRRILQAERHRYENDTKRDSKLCTLFENTTEYKVSSITRHVYHINYKEVDTELITFYIV